MGRRRNVVGIDPATIYQLSSFYLLTDAERNAIQTKVSVEFPREAWDAIDGCRLEYMWFRTVQLHGVSSSDFKSLVCTVHDAARTLYNFLFDYSRSAYSGWDRITWVCFRGGGRGKYKLKYANAISEIGELALASFNALAEVQEQKVATINLWPNEPDRLAAGFYNKAALANAWKLFIGQLAEIARKHGMEPTTDKKAGTTLSPFCRFVKAILQTMPRDLAEHRHSDAAMTDAVDDALPPRRKTRRRKTSEIENADPRDDVGFEKLEKLNSGIDNAMSVDDLDAWRKANIEVISRLSKIWRDLLADLYNERRQELDGTWRHAHEGFEELEKLKRGIDAATSVEELQAWHKANIERTNLLPVDYRDFAANLYTERLHELGYRGRARKRFEKLEKLKRGMDATMSFEDRRAWRLAVQSTRWRRLYPWEHHRD
jgi:hypothetical protein